MKEVTLLKASEIMIEFMLANKMVSLMYLKLLITVHKNPGLRTLELDKIIGLNSSNYNALDHLQRRGFLIKKRTPTFGYGTGGSQVRWWVSEEISNELDKIR